MNRPQDIVRLASQEAIKVGGFQARPHLADTRPVLHPDSREERQGSALVEGEPGVPLLLAVVELREARQGHYATVLNAHPAVPMRVPSGTVEDVADVGGPAIQLHLKECLEDYLLALLAELVRAAASGVVEGLLAGGEAPPAFWSVPNEGRGLVRKDAGPGCQVADGGGDEGDIADELKDGLDVGGVAVEVAHGADSIVQN